MTRWKDLIKNWQNLQNNNSVKKITLLQCYFFIWVNLFRKKEFVISVKIGVFLSFEK